MAKNRTLPIIIVAGVVALLLLAAGGSALLWLYTAARGDGFAGGHARFYYASEVEAQQAIQNGPIVVSDGGTTYTLTPRRDPDEHVVLYDIEARIKKDQVFTQDQQLIDAIIATAPSPKPAEISSLVVANLRHSEGTHQPCADIQAFVRYFMDERPHCDYTVDEVRAKLPVALQPEFDRQVPASGGSFTITLDWPEDERDLIIDFAHDPDESNKPQLGGYGLHPPASSTS